MQEALTECLHVQLLSHWPDYTPRGSRAFAPEKSTVSVRLWSSISWVCRIVGRGQEPKAQAAIRQEALFVAQLRPDEERTERKTVTSIWRPGLCAWGSSRSVSKLMSRSPFHTYCLSSFLLIAFPKFTAPLCVFSC